MRSLALASLLLGLLVGVGFFAAPTTVHADVITSSFATAAAGAADWLASYTIFPILRNVVYLFTVVIGTVVAYISSYILGFSTFLTLQSESYSLAFIATAWEQVRNLTNITFIFILLYIAYTIMLRAEQANTMHLLAAVVVVALVVNFSFFFTRLVIDAGNILAWQFYNQINVTTGLVGPATNAGGVAALQPNAVNRTDIKDLSAAIMGGTNVQGALGLETFTKMIATSSNSDFTKTVTVVSVYITVGIMLFVLAGLFLAAGVKFIMRTVMLWLAIIASPLAFAAAALPQTRSYARRWLNIVVVHSFFPAAFLFMFYILTNFANSLAGGTGGLLASTSGIGGIGGGTVDILSTIATTAIRLGFVLGMLYLALRVSDYLSSMAGDYTNRIAGSITSRYWQGVRQYRGFAGRQVVTGGVAAPLLRATVGDQGRTGVLTRGGLLLSGRKNRLLRAAGSGIVKTGDFLANRSFDTRNIPGVTAAVNALLQADIGKSTWKPTGQISEQILAHNAKKKAKKDSEAFAALEPRYQALAAKNAYSPALSPRAYFSGTHRTAAEEREFTELGKQRSILQGRIGNLEEPQLTALNRKDLEGILKEISEKQVETLKKAYNPTEFKRLLQQWHETSSKAPLGEAKQQMGKLTDIHNALEKMARPAGPGTATTNTHADRAISSLTALVAAATTRDFTVDAATKKKIKDEVDKQIEEQTRERAITTDKGERAKKDAVIRTLKEAAKRADALKLDGIPEQAGNDPRPKAFKYTKRP